jgi:5-methyltetrahydrofolate--homocysteine methyltransferase
MGTSVFSELLALRPILVADGAMGTSLFDLGLESGGCPEFLNVDRPELIGKVHTQFIEAGSDIILTNTFGGNRKRLALHEAENRVAELNEAAVEVALQAVSAADQSVAVAASIGPTGDLYEPVGPLSYDEGLDVFGEQIRAVAAAGADIIWIETMSSIEEIDAAYDAAQEFDLPTVVTLSFDTSGRTMMGVRPSEVAEWAGRQKRPPTAIGANCGIGPADVVQATFDMVGFGGIAVAKANCGIPLYSDGVLSYPTGPEAMDDYVEMAARSGARIIGSCCGSGPAHVKAIRQAVDRYEVGPSSLPATSAEEIAKRLGGEVRVEAAPRVRKRRRSG